MKIFKYGIKFLLKKCRREGLELICIGAGAGAQDIIRKHPKLINYIKCFTDNSKDKIGTKMNIENKEFNIYATNNIKEHITNKTIILNTCTAKEAILEQLNGLLQNVEVAVYDYYSLYPELDDIEWFEKAVVESCVIGEQFRIDDLHEEIEDQDAYLEEKRKYFRDKNHVVVPNVVYILSNKCTLRCKHCSMLMPSFKTPWEIEVQDAIRDLELFLSAVDECIAVNLIGGEPLIYKDLHIVIEYLQQHPKVKEITINTNSTYIPSDNIIKALTSSKVMVCLSDYGHIEKMAKMVALLEKYNINFMIRTDQKWVDFGNTVYRKKEEDMLRYEYMNCEFAVRCKAIYAGKFFSCERAARLYMLDEYKAQDDYIDLYALNDNKMLRQGIQKMLIKDTAEACNYCSAKEEIGVPVGEQIGGNFIQSKYTLVKREDL